MKKFKRIFITTAIDYVNAFPHLGHALEKVQADVIARYFRFLGEKTFFLTGTDENSLKNVRAAEKEGISVKKLVDRNSKRFLKLKEILNLSFDDFIKTTEKRHVKGAQKLWKACKKDIYKGKYKGLYCVGCEAFLKEKDLKDGLCPEHKSKPELVEEENYFFRLSKYQKILKKIIEEGKIKIIPEVRRKETLSFINSGLEDLCISRSIERAKDWGIDVPGDKNQKIWVWFDALSNYINALGYGTSPKKFKKLWEESFVIHVIGKSVLKFHTVYWPAILLSAGISLPNLIFVHGNVTNRGEKMSKSLGNVVDPFELVRKYGRDSVRYYLLREFSPTKDCDFTEERFKERYNADLAEGLGNLVSRILGMVKKYSQGKIPKIKNDPNLHPLIIYSSKKTWKEVKNYLSNFEFNKALISIWNFMKKIDKYIEDNKPWDLFRKGEKEKLNWVLYGLINSLSQISWQIYPFLPETSQKIAKILGIKELLAKNPNYKYAQKINIKTGKEIKKAKPLFPKIN